MIRYRGNVRQMRIPNFLVHRAGQWYIRRICSNEFRHQVFSVHNERSIEYRFALQALGETRPRTVLDVGTGTTAWPHLLRNCGYVVTAVDNVRDYWPKGMVNRHWFVLDVDIVNPDGKKVAEKYDAITCISVLEHIEDHLRAIRNMGMLLKTGGLLILTTPFSHHNPDPNVYVRADALYGQDLPYICRSSSATELNQWLACDLKLESRELWRLFTGPVWATGQRCAWERAETESQPHQLGCFLLRKM
jgi:2-polyprenyl-3-methyl-5-hydroxy-6-metoxy-1,4-benzoquinol methylase